METIELSLDDSDSRSVEGLRTSKAAVEICKIYFRRQNPAVTFAPSPKGADLHVRFPRRRGFDIEVKGTGKPAVAWSLLKVSGTPSYNMLKSGMPLYRVSNIGSHDVKISVMKYGVDFDMTNEPRWRIRPLGKR